MPIEVRDCFAELVPLLRRIEETFPSSSASAELAQQIRLALCTRGAYSVPSSTHLHRCVILIDLIISIEVGAWFTSRLKCQFLLCSSKPLLDMYTKIKSNAKFDKFWTIYAHFSF